jgi:hypothetical protein
MLCYKMFREFPYLVRLIYLFLEACERHGAGWRVSCHRINYTGGSHDYITGQDPKSRLKTEKYAYQNAINNYTMQ